MMLISLVKYLFYFLICFIIFIFLFLIYFENKKRKKIKNIKTKEKINGPNIFSIFIYKIFYQTKNYTFSKYLKEKTKGLKIYGYFILNRFIISVSDPNLSQRIMTETDLFIKKQANEEKGFLGGKHIVRSNGFEWKNQRKILNKAFYNLDIFNKIFLEKTKLILKLFKENRNEKTFEIKNFEKLIQNFTIDILGKTIFGYDFNALSGNLKKELISYNFIMERVFSFEHLFFSKLNSFLPSFLKNKNLNKF